jgi:hypothetical protein
MTYLICETSREGELEGRTRKILLSRLLRRCRRRDFDVVISGAIEVSLSRPTRCDLRARGAVHGENKDNFSSNLTYVGWRRRQKPFIFARPSIITFSYINLITLLPFMSLRLQTRPESAHEMSGNNYNLSFTYTFQRRLSLTSSLFSFSFALSDAEKNEQKRKSTKTKWKYFIYGSICQSSSFVVRLMNSLSSCRKLRGMLCGFASCIHSSGMEIRSALMYINV